MSNLELSSKSLFYLFQVLSYNNTVKKLDISHNDLAEIFEKNCTNLFEILTTRGANRKLNQNSTLEEIVLINCNINFLILSSLLNLFGRLFKLARINFNENPIKIHNTSKQIEVISSDKYAMLAVSQADTICISKAEIHADAIFPLFCLMKNIIDLNISGCNLSLQGAYDLVTFLQSSDNRLQRLDLSNNKILTECISVLVDSLLGGDIVDLNLSSNTLTHTGISILSKYGVAERKQSKVRRLNLANTYLNVFDQADLGQQSIADIMTSKAFPNLEYLNLKSNKINGKGAYFISEALKVNTFLKELDLEDNAISEQGARYLAEGLKFNKTLITLNVSKNPAVDIVIFELDTNEKSDFEGNPLRSNSMISAIIKYSKNLLHLSTSQNFYNINDFVSMSQVLKDSALVYLNLSSNRISGDCVLMLRDYLSSCKLEYLDLSNNNLGSEGTIILFFALRKHKNCRLKTLNISRNNLTCEALHYKTGKEQIEEFTEFTEFLQNNTSLIHLDISHNSITNQGFNLLLFSLWENLTLEIFNVNFNKIDNNCLKSVETFLNRNTNLQKLQLKGNIFTYDAINLMFEDLSLSFTLTRLDLDFTVEN